MEKLEGFCRKAIKLGATKAKIIKAEEVVVADWVRLKCQYGCGGYGGKLDSKLRCLPGEIRYPDVSG